MVAIITGNSLGVLNSSAWVLGANGQLGSAPLGRSGESVYVNGSSGNLVLTGVDEMLFGLGPDSAITRTHNNQATSPETLSNNDGDNNDGWRLGFSRRVFDGEAIANPANEPTYATPADGDTIKRVDWDGSISTYTYTSGYQAEGESNKYWVCTDGSGAYDTLSYAGGSWTWRDGDSRITETYTANAGSWRITARTDIDGNALTYRYNANGYVDKVTTEDGDYTEMTYSGANLTSITTTYHDVVDSSVKTVSRVYYTYLTDGTNRLQKVTVDLSPQNSLGSDVYETTYTYDGTSNRIASVLQTDGSRLDFTYETTGQFRVLTVAQTTDGASRTTSFAYGSNQTTVTDAGGQTTVLNYDGEGKLDTIVRPAIVSGGSHQTYDFDYTTSDDVSAISLGSTNAVVYEYDPHGNRTKERDAAGNTVERTFNDKNQLLTEVRYLVPDNTSPYAPGTPLVTRHTYDTEGHLVFTVSPEGRVTEYKYDLLPGSLPNDGQLTSVVQYTGGTMTIPGEMANDQTFAVSDFSSFVTSNKAKSTRTYFDYDFRGNVSRSRTHEAVDSSGVGVGTGDAVTDVYFYYDQTGKLVKRVVAGSSDTELYTYDGLGRQLTVKDFHNHTTTTGYLDSARKTTVTYANGLVETSLYDKSGELIKFWDGLGTDTVAASSESSPLEAYTYDNLGRLRTKTDRSGNKTWLFYDALNRLTAEVGADKSVVEYRYLESNNQLAVTIRYNSLTSAVVGTLSDPTKTVADIRPSSYTDARWEWRFYDSAQRLIEIVDDIGAATSFVYDGLSRLLTTTSYYTAVAGSTLAAWRNTTTTPIATPPTTAVVPSTHSSDRTTRSFYDQDGLQIGRLDAKGYLTQFIYDTVGRLVETIAFANASSANWTTGTFAQLLAGVTADATKDLHTYRVYDARGLLRYEIDGERNVSRFEYSALGYLKLKMFGNVLSTSQMSTFLAGARTPAALATILASNSEVVDKTEYERDLYGSVTSEKRYVRNGVGTLVVETDTYVYDNMHRLTSVTRQSVQEDPRTTTYRYDLRGQLIGELSGEGSLALALSGFDTIQTGTSGGETLNGGSGKDLIKALGGGDTLNGLDGDDRLEGGDGNDTLAGGIGSNLLIGGLGDDSYVVSSATDLIVEAASAGADTLTSSVSFTLTAGASIETMSLSGTSALTLAGNELNNTINGNSGANTLWGNAGDDTLVGNAGADILVGGAGNDTLTGGADGDTYVFAPGEGTDVITDFSVASDVIDLRAFGVAPVLTNQGPGTNALITIGSWSVKLTGISTASLTSANFLGWSGLRTYDNTPSSTNSNNTINGTTGKDFIDGKAGNDTITGGNGDDTIQGGKDNDTMTGGAGSDVFYFSGTDMQANDVDTITDFQIGVDYLDMTAYAGFYTISQNGADTWITGTGGASAPVVKLLGITATSLTPSHFMDLSVGIASAATSPLVPPTPPVGSYWGKLTIDEAYLAYGTTYDYDAAGRLRSKTDPNGVDAAGNRTYYYYNTDGQLIYEIRAVGAGATIVGEAVEYTYNAFGEVIGTRVHATPVPSDKMLLLEAARVSTDPVTSAALTSATIDGYVADSSSDSTTTTTYNSTGTVATFTDARGSLTTYSGYGTFREWATSTTMLNETPTPDELRIVNRSFDTRGLLAWQEVDATEASGGAGLRRTSYVYDAFGRTTRVTDPRNNNRDVTYDRAGRVLTSTDAMGWTTSYTLVDGSTGYDGRGNLLRKVDPYGNATTYSYTELNRKVTTVTPEAITSSSELNAFGQTIRVTDGAGRTTGYAYDHDGNLKTITDGAGNVVTNSYDMAGRLAQVVDARGFKTTYTYDAANRVLTRKVDDGGLNLLTSYAYDAKGQQVSVTDPSGTITTITYSNGGDRTSVVVDSAGLTLRTDYAYDKGGRTLSVSEGVVGLTAARVTQYTYNRLDEVTKVQVDPSGLNLTTDYDYDKNGNMVAKTETVSTTPTLVKNVTRYVYDKENRLNFTVDATGAVTETTYTKNGKTETVRAYANRVAAGTLAGWNAEITSANVTGAVSTSANDEVTTHVYDKDNRLRYVLDATRRPTEYIYDGAGNVIRAVAHAGSIGTGAPTLTYIADQIGAFASGVTANARTTRAVFDAANRQVYSIDAGGAVTAFSYDDGGNVVKQVRFKALYGAGETVAPQPSDMTTWITANADATKDRVSRSFYDGAGRAIYSVDPEGYVTQYKYDADGSVTEQIRLADRYTVSDTTTSADLAAMIGTPPSTAATTKYTYDTAGRLVDTYDPMNNRTHLVLDLLGQAVEIHRAYGTSDASKTTRVYDKGGRVTSETRGVGDTNPATTTWAYDGVGRLVTETRGAGSDDATTTYTYDGVGNVLTESVQLVSGTNAVTTKTYDAFGNVLTATDPRGGVGYFFYDKLNRLVMQVDPERYATATEYSIGDQATKVTRYFNTIPAGTPTGAAPTAHGSDAVTTIERDKLDRVTKVTDAEGFYETYALSAFGDRLTVTNKLGGVTTNVFDKRGQLISETLPVKSTSASGVESSTNVVNTYEYDARGNQTKTTEAAGFAEERVTTLVYDKCDRLTSKSGDRVTITNSTTFATTTNQTPTESIVYDGRGNVIQTIKADGAKTFFYYDKLDRKIAEIDALGSMKAWTYDDRNNAKTERVYGTAVTLPGSPGGTPPTAPTAYRETLSFYDLNNRLIETKVVGLRFGAYTTSYATAIGDLRTLYTYDASGNVVRTQVLANGVEQSNTYTYYDKLGRKIATIDPLRYFTWLTLDGEGNVTKEERYANQVWTSLSENTDPAVYRAEADDGAVRTTNFTYDRNGRRLTEQRTGLTYYTVGSTGALTTTTNGSATITYAYNGLGNVTRKTEATGDYIDYSYDVLGRQTAEKTSAFTDYTGASVKRQTETYYNGLGGVTRQVVRKVTPGSPDVADTNTANWRVTTYTYGAGGRAATMTDAEGFVHTYGYDIAGRVVKDEYSRVRATGSAVTEAINYRYDLLGRVTSQGNAGKSGSTWTFGDTNQVRYDAYGQVTGKGANGMWQETFDYDAGGRLWRSTSGDGTARIFISDGAGHATMTFASSGTGDLSSYTTLEAAVDALDAGGAIGAVAISGIAMTINVYDTRGQSTATREPFRQLTVGGAFNNTIVHSRTYNAYGEVASETNARGYTTDFTYNAMGRLIKREAPSVSWTSESGAVASIRPTEEYYFDASGRLVGVKDANGNINTRALLANTGHGDAEPIVTAEFNADSTISKTGVDVFGDERRFSVWSGGSELAGVETRDYDKMGRMITQTHPLRTGGVQLVDHYEYDGLGQRMRHWNSQIGASFKDETNYDAQGRVLSFNDLGNHQTTYTYTWSSTLATNLASGTLGTFGGWIVTTTNSTGLTSTDKKDYFGRISERTDFGGHNYLSVYDKAGRVVSELLSGYGKSFTYFNTGLIATTTDTSTGDPIFDTTVSTEYAYDLEGNRVLEKHSGTYVESGVSKNYVHQNASATWDALNRLVSFSDAGSSGTTNGDHVGGGAATTAYEYDKNGNVRRINATFIDPITLTSTPQEYWYKYDSMNRFTTTMGTLSGGVITRGTKGTDISYDGWGRRALAISTNYESTDHREVYNYTEDGYLLSVWMGDGFTPTNGTTVTNKAENVRDAMGRLIDYFEFKLTTGGTVVQTYRREATYDTGNLLTHDVVTIRKDGDGTRTLTTDYGYNAETTPGSWTFTGAFQGGAVTHSETVVSDGPDTRTKTTYEWYTAAQDLKVTYDKDTGDSTNNLWVTDNYRTTSGRLVYAHIDDGNDREIVYTSDAMGQILTRRQQHGSENTKPVNYYYYFDGMRVGEVNNKKTVDRDYAMMINKRYSGINHPTATYADFDQSYTPIDGDAEKSLGGSYTVNNGDTLQSIANDLYGDSSLWYLIAEANGLNGTENLVAGQSLNLSSKTVNVHNNSETFRPYNPNKAIGNNAPTQPKPGGDAAKCSAAQIVVVVIAVVVTAMLLGPASGAMAQMFQAMGLAGTAGGGGVGATVAATVTSVGGSGVAAGSAAGIAGSIVGGAIAGAAGSAASQLAGMALGVQDKFDWKGVGIAAISGGVGAGFGSVGPLQSAATGDALMNVGKAMVRGGLGNALTQGISVATGLQSKFDWTGVAAGAITAGVFEATSGWAASFAPVGTVLNKAIAGVASATAGAATRTLMDGTNFGDNMLAALPDVIGTTIGNMVLDGLGMAPAAGSAPPTSGGNGSQDSLASTPGAGMPYLIDLSRTYIGPREAQFELSDVQTYGAGDAMLAGGSIPPPIRYFVEPSARSKSSGSNGGGAIRDESIEPPTTVDEVVVVARRQNWLEQFVDDYKANLRTDTWSLAAYTAESVLRQVGWDDAADVIQFTNGARIGSGGAIVRFGGQTIQGVAVTGNYLLGFTQVGQGLDMVRDGTGWDIPGPSQRGSNATTRALVETVVDTGTKLVQYQMAVANGDRDVFADIRTTTSRAASGVASEYREAARLGPAALGEKVGGDVTTVALNVASVVTPVAEIRAASVAGSTLRATVVAESQAARAASGIAANAKIESALVERIAAAERAVPLTRAEQLALNAANGGAFEEAGIRGILSHVGLGKNTTPVTRNGVTTIVDSAGRPAGLVEFKDVARLSSSPQLRAQLAEALTTRQPYNLVVSPGNKTISGPLMRQIERTNQQILRLNPASSGGGVFRYNPATDVLTPY